MLATEVIFAALVGAMLGSFLNVVVYRLPRGESLLSPGSHCTSCRTSVKPYDNVPVLAWMWLHGRCRACRAAISPRYPLVEAATAALCAGVVLARSSAGGVSLGVLAVLVLVPVGLIDLDHHVIPNRITGPAAILAIALVVGVLAGLVVLSRRAPGARHGVGVPFGPFLALGGLVALFAGPAIIAAYLHHLT